MILKIIVPVGILINAVRIWEIYEKERTNKEMYYVSTEKKIDTQQLMKLMKQTYWASERSEEDVITTIRNSLSFGAFDEKDNLVGFARVVTDYVSIWYLCDVIVDEKYRGQGIGKMLISAVVSDERFAKASALLKTKDAHGLYRKYGFKDVDVNRVMYREKEN